MRARLGTIVVGLGLGAVLQRAGFASWDEIHKMFTFADLRLLLGFMSAVVVLFVAWRIIRARGNPGWSPRLLHPGVIPGSILFGTGWALCGACPAIALVQLGEGRWLAGATLLGILIGNGLYPVAHRQWFRWSARSCADN